MAKKHAELVRRMVSGLSPEVAQLAENTAGILAELGPEYDRKCEDYILNLAGSITGKHFNEEAAGLVIARMVPTELLTADGCAYAGSLSDYLQASGMTATAARMAVKEAYSRQCEKVQALALEPLPALPDASDWDCLVLVARAVSDYWNIVCGDLKVAAEIAASDLADRDGCWCRKWESLIR